MSQGNGGLPLERLALFERAGTFTRDAWFGEALQTLRACLSIDRAAIGVFDEAGVMRFRASCGLSGEFCSRLDGYSPWPADVDPGLGFVALIEQHTALGPLGEGLEQEGIRSAGFVPLVSAGRLIGAFMLGYPEPHDLTPEEERLVRVLAGQVAFAVDRSRTEGELRSHAEELGAILRTVSDAITVQEPTGRLRYANDGAAIFAGFKSASELLEAGYENVVKRFEILDERGMPIAMESWPPQVAVATRREVRSRVRLRFVATGEERYLSTRCIPVCGEKGAIRFVVSVFRDITDQGRAEERALQSANRVERLQRFTAAIGDALSLEQVAQTVVRHGRDALGATAGVVFHLAKTEDHLELVAASGLEKRVLDGFRSVDLDEHTPITDAIREGQPILLRNLEERQQAYPYLEQGSMEGAFAAIPIGRYAALGLHFAGPRSFTGEDRDFCQTLTGQCAHAFERALLYEAEREARAEAEDAQRHLAFLAETSALLGSSLDYEVTLNQVARAAVPAMADWCAVELDTGEEDSILIALHHRDPARLERARNLRETSGGASPYLRHILETGEAMLQRDIAEQDIRTWAQSDSQARMLLELGLRFSLSVPIRAAGATLGVITLATAESGRRYTQRDLSTAMRLAERVAVTIENATLYRGAQEARERAREAERRKDEFLAMLGHELRNPLAPIVTALELMRLSNDNRTAFARERAVIDRHVRYLLRLVDDLLDISRITQGKLRLKREFLEIRDIVADAIEVASPLIEERNHWLDVRVADVGLRVNGDRVRLSQVVSNLLTNAARYTDPGGRITITAEGGPAQVVLAVEDNGMGIEETTIPRIFELFEQGGTKTDGVGGLGLGLTIVRRLVEMHGGRIAASSSGLGQGSRFEVRLPAALERRKSSESQRMRAAVQTTIYPRRVLIVDDNRDAAELLAIALSSAGYETATAGDGPGALELAAQFRPDVALLDIGLPVMDGYQLARRLRESRGGSVLRLVALTGYGQEKDRQRALESGFDAHFVKPISLEAVIDALARLVQTARDDFAGRVSD